MVGPFVPRQILEHMQNIFNLIFSFVSHGYLDTKKVINTTMRGDLHQPMGQEKHFSNVN